MFAGEALATDVVAEVEFGCDKYNVVIRKIILKQFTVTVVWHACQHIFYETVLYFI